MAIDLGEVTGLKASKEKKKENVKIANGLDKDAFMKLFLEQLKNQDPTAPMETDKIISQTAQLTQVEMQEENKKTMKEVAEAMKSTEGTNKSLQDFQKEMKKSLDTLNMGMQMSTDAQVYASKIGALNAMGMIGKIAETEIKAIDVKGGMTQFSLYFDNEIDASKGTPMIEIMNESKEVVKTIPIEDKHGQQGYINFSWDGKKDDGSAVQNGSYIVIAQYNLDPETNKYDRTRVGRGEIQSVIYEKGMPLIRMDNDILPMDSAVEFYQKGDKGYLASSFEAIRAQAGKIARQQEQEKQGVNLEREVQARLEGKNDANAEVNEETLALNDAIKGYSQERLGTQEALQGSKESSKKVSQENRPSTGKNSMMVQDRGQGQTQAQNAMQVTKDQLEAQGAAGSTHKDSSQKVAV